jgi:hypothetical protein
MDAAPVDGLVGTRWSPFWNAMLLRPVYMTETRDGVGNHLWPQIWTQFQAEFGESLVLSVKSEYPFQ